MDVSILFRYLSFFSCNMYAKLAVKILSYWKVENGCDFKNTLLQRGVNSSFQLQQSFE